MADQGGWVPVSKLLETAPPADTGGWVPAGSTDAAAAAPQAQAPGWLHTLGDVGKSVGSGLVSGLVSTPGMAADLVRLSGLGIGKLTGDEQMAQNAREGLAGGVGGSEWLKRKLIEGGVLDYHPDTEAGKWAYTAGDFAGGGIGTGGAGALLRGGLKVGTEAAIKAGIKKALSPAEQAVQTALAASGPNTAAQIAKQGITGAGAGLGMQAADAGLDAMGGADAHPWLRTGADLAGAVVGGGVAGGLHNLGARTGNQFTDAYKELGVQPRFPSDINPSIPGRPNTGGGAVNSFMSKTLPDTFGAQNVSRSSAADVQQQISEAAQQALGLGNRTSQGFLKDSKAFHVAQEGTDDLSELIRMGLQGDAAASGGATFNLDKFMSEYNAMPSTDRYLLTAGNKDLETTLKKVALAYQGTAQSRQLAEKQVQDALHSTSAYGLPGLVAAGAGFLGHGLGESLGIGTAVGAAKGVGAQMAARLSQGGPFDLGAKVTSFMSKPLGPGAIQNSGKYLGPGVMGADQSVIGQVPPYQPPVPVPTQPAGSNVHSWLGTLPKEQAVAYIGQKLGPQVASQLAQNQDDESYAAAMMNLTQNPMYRSRLTG